MRVSKGFVNTFLAAAVSIVMNGCTLVQAGFESQAEVPSLENQANRVVIGMGLIRTNTTISNMPISADAVWPEELSDELLFEDNKEIITAALADDPYVATHVYTDKYQKKVLKGVEWLPAPRIDILTYHALNRAIILYGPEEENWPTFFDIETDLGNFHTFKDGRLKQVEAVSGNIYENIADAVISLMPTNFQKDLEEAEREMAEAFFEVAQSKAEKGEYETAIKDSSGQSRYGEDVFELKMKISILEREIVEREMIADEKEAIYFTLLDEAIEVLKNDIELDEEQVGLAENIILASEAVKKGALEAGAAFSLALTNISTKNILQNFKKELRSLAVAKMYVPWEKRKLYKRRVARIAANALYSLPAIAIGSYYAVKQAALAEKYERVAEIIVEAHVLEK